MKLTKEQADIEIQRLEKFGFFLKSFMFGVFFALFMVVITDLYF